MISRTSLLLAALLLGSCGLFLPDPTGENAPGEGCHDGPDCQSGVCLKNVHCEDGRRLDICSGDACLDGTCPGQQTCLVPLGLSQGHCYPDSACQSSDGDGG